MPKSDQKDIQHMRWLVEWRCANQQCCMRLFELLEKHPEKWSQDNFHDAQDMVGAAFSLWRAVFLGEKRGTKQLVYQHFLGFLSGLIEDNSISYAQDKKNNEWTFNYYVENARFRLEELARNWDGPGKLTAWKVKSRLPTERWEYAHTLLEEAVSEYARRFSRKR